MINIIRSIINFFGFNDAIVDGIGERGMRDSSIIRYNEVPSDCRLLSAILFASSLVQAVYFCV